MAGLEWIKDKNLTDENLRKVKAVQAIANELDVPIAALAIAWCVKNPYVTTAILGATKVYQLEENLKALEVLPRLTDEVMLRIQKALA